MPRSRKLDVSTLPVLNEQQVGHIRHVDNLARQPKGDWSHMAGRHPFQEDFGSYRFQIAYMAYALGLTHFHRLPAAQEPSLREISPNVNVLRAWFDRDSASLVFTLSKRKDRAGDASLLINHVWNRDSWTLSGNGLPLATGDEQSVIECSMVGVKRSADKLELSCPIEEETTFVLSWKYPFYQEEGNR